MSKPKYRLDVTLTDGVKEWDVCVYRNYPTMEDAMNGLKCFSSIGYTIVGVKIKQHGGD